MHIAHFVFEGLLLPLPARPYAAPATAYLATRLCSTGVAGIGVAAARLADVREMATLGSRIDREIGEFVARAICDARRQLLCSPTTVT